MEQIHLVVEQVFRQESGTILAALIGGVDDFTLAEDALQDALLVALERWPREGVPQNPPAWILTTARHKAIDRLRRPGPYQIQAAISALHAQAERADQTDWPQIAALYQRLVALSPSPVIELNRVAAIAMAECPEQGLALLAELIPSLTSSE